MSSGFTAVDDFGNNGDKVTASSPRVSFPFCILTPVSSTYVSFDSGGERYDDKVRTDESDDATSGPRFDGREFTEDVECGEARSDSIWTEVAGKHVLDSRDEHWQHVSIIRSGHEVLPQSCPYFFYPKNKACIVHVVP